MFLFRIIKYIKFLYINLLKYVGKDIFKEIELDYKICINSLSQIKDEDSSIDDKMNDCLIYINKVKITIKSTSSDDLINFIGKTFLELNKPEAIYVNNKTKGVQKTKLN